MSPRILPVEPTVCHHAQKLEKIARIQAAFVNSLTMKTLPDDVLVFNYMMSRLKTWCVMFMYDAGISLLPYNNHQRGTVLVFLPQSYFPCVYVSLPTR